MQDGVRKMGCASWGYMGVLERRVGIYLLGCLFTARRAMSVLGCVACLAPVFQRWPWQPEGGL